MKNPLVSVIIPYYNGAPFIDQCLESVFSQTYRNYEIIVVDDCSSHDHKLALDSFNGKISYHRLCENHGRPSPVKNYGISVAKGELIAFLDQDDWWEPDKLVKQVPLFDDDHVGLVFSNAKLYDNETRFIYDKTYDGFDLSLTCGDVARSLFRCNFIVSCTVVVRKEYLDRVGGFDDRYAAADDYELWYRLAKVCDFRVIDEPLAVHRMSSHSISCNRQQSVLADSITFYQDHFDDAIGIDQEEKNLLLASRINNLSIYLTLAGRFSEARSWIRKSRELLNYPTRLYYMITYAPYLIRFMPKFRQRFKFQYNPLHVNW